MKIAIIIFMVVATLTAVFALAYTITDIIKECREKSGSTETPKSNSTEGAKSSSDAN